jgi:hypothetical protein
MAYETDPKGYWEERLKRDFNPRGVGHMGFGMGEKIFLCSKADL